MTDAELETKARLMAVRFFHRWSTPAYPDRLSEDAAVMASPEELYVAPKELAELLAGFARTYAAGVER
jgi:hypothetical protein